MYVQASFYVKDAEDSIELEANDYAIDGYLGKFTPIFTGIKNPDGKYLVTWKYEVNDSKLNPLTTPTAETHSKDQTYTLNFKSGADTLTADVVIHLDGRDEIEFVGGEHERNNVIKGIIQTDPKLNNLGNDVIYFGDGNGRADAEDGSDVIYGGGGEDSSYISANGSIFFGEQGSDNVSFYDLVKDVLAFGGDGNDTFKFNYGSGLKVYTWDGSGTDTYLQTPFSFASLDKIWVIDFDSNKPEFGGDVIRFRSPTNYLYVTWKIEKTKLIENHADGNHPFLSEGATYYELRTIDSFGTEVSVLNLVGINGTEITLDGLFANGNLV